MFFKNNLFLLSLFCFMLLGSVFTNCGCGNQKIPASKITRKSTENKPTEDESNLTPITEEMIQKARSSSNMGSLGESLAKTLEKLKNGESVTDVELKNALDLATWISGLDIPQALVDRIKDINKVISEPPDDPNRFVSLLYYNRIDMLKLLIEKGLNVNQVYGRNGFSLVKAAVFNQKKEMLQLILDNIDKKASVSINDQPKQTGFSPLHVALLNDQNIEIVKSLLEAGADINLKDNDGRFPLHLAASAHDRDPEVVKLLLDKGANTQINAKDNEGKTPLHLAAQWEAIDAQVIELLLNRGSNIEARDNGGRTPLHLAAENGTLEAVKSLLKAGAVRAVEDNDRKTPLQLAMDHRNGVHYDEIIDLLQNPI